MSATTMKPVETLSAWRPRSLAIMMSLVFAILILISVKAYERAPPIPARVVDQNGAAIFTGKDVSTGQQIFLKYGLMDSGTIWGHGGMLEPDFSAQALHGLALHRGESIAQDRFHRSHANLGDVERSAVDGTVASQFKANNYDAPTGILTLPYNGEEAFDAQVASWTAYFKDPAVNGGLARNSVTDPAELRQLTAFFEWTAWASVAKRPGTPNSYTNNFPYHPMVGNHPTGGTALWSAISVLFLLGGTAVVLLAFDKFDFLGWHGRDASSETRGAPMALRSITPAQSATLKFMVIAALLFLAQALIGGGVAHYRAQPETFYGLGDLSVLWPSNLLRTWHLQLATFLIATAYAGGALFVASALGGGVIGTAHHWYFTGQSEFAMALGATFSALEVVPLTLLTLDAWDFYSVTRGNTVAYNHRWTYYFLMAVGFWNFTGAGSLWIPHQHADRRLLRGRNDPDHQPWPCRVRGCVRHARRWPDGLCAARADQPRGLVENREVRQVWVLGTEYRACPDGRPEPIPQRTVAGMGCAAKRILACPLSGLYWNEARAIPRMDTPLGQYSIHFGRRGSIAHRADLGLSESGAAARETCGGPARSMNQRKP